MERAEYAADHFPIRLQDNWRAALVVLLVGAAVHADGSRVPAILAACMDCTLCDVHLPKGYHCFEAWLRC